MVGACETEPSDWEGVVFSETAFRFVGFETALVFGGLSKYVVSSGKGIDMAGKVYGVVF